MSERATLAEGSTALQDLGVTTDEDNAKAIGKTKIRRERSSKQRDLNKYCFFN